MCRSPNLAFGRWCVCRSSNPQANGDLREGFKLGTRDYRPGQRSPGEMGWQVPEGPTPRTEKEKVYNFISEMRTGI